MIKYFLLQNISDHSQLTQGANGWSKDALLQGFTLTFCATSSWWYVMQSSRATVPSIDPRQTALTQQSFNDDTEGGVIVTNADLNHNNNKKQLENLSGGLIFDAWMMLVSSHEQMSLKMTMSWWRFQCTACSYYNCNNLIHTTWVRTLILHYLYQCWARGHRQGWHHCIVSSHHQVMLPLNNCNTTLLHPSHHNVRNLIS